MRRGTCVKCQNATVIAARNAISDQSSHTPMWPHAEGRRRGMVRASQNQVWQFACTTCGYLEWWVLDPETLADMQSSWVAVPPQ